MSTTLLSNLLSAAGPLKPTIAAPKKHMKALSEYTEGMPVGDEGWTIRVVSPKEANWPARDTGGHSPLAYSDLGSRVTKLRVDAMSQPPDVIRRALAHELGHITLQTTDESKANRWADTFLKGM